jgi:copper chaperone CopZ
MIPEVFHMKPTEITIEGMHCEGCVQRVQKALKKVPGIVADKVEIGRAIVQIAAGQEPAVLAALEDMGFDARIANKD